MPPPHSYPQSGFYGQSEGILERINEPPWGRCLQGAVDARWVVVAVVVCCVVVVAPGGAYGLIVLRRAASCFVASEGPRAVTELSFGPSRITFPKAIAKTLI